MPNGSEVINAHTAAGRCPQFRIHADRVKRHGIDSLTKILRDLDPLENRRAPARAIDRLKRRDRQPLRRLNFRFRDLRGITNRSFRRILRVVSRRTLAGKLFLPAIDRFGSPLPSTAHSISRALFFFPPTPSSITILRSNFAASAMADRVPCDRAP